MPRPQLRALNCCIVFAWASSPWGVCAFTGNLRLRSGTRCSPLDLLATSRNRHARSFQFAPEPFRIERLVEPMTAFPICPWQDSRHLCSGIGPAGIRLALQASALRGHQPSGRVGGPRISSVYNRRSRVFGPIPPFVRGRWASSAHLNDPRLSSKVAPRFDKLERTPPRQGC